MTTSPTNDVMALERLRTLLTEAIDKPGIDSPAEHAEDALTALPAARFERTVNDAGVPMRRVVACGEWEMDPCPTKRGPMSVPDFAASPPPAIPVEKLHALWRSIYSADQAALSSEQRYSRDLVARLRAAIYDVATQFGTESPEHQRIRYALTGRGPGSPSEQALEAVAEADRNVGVEDVVCGETACPDFGSRNMGEGTCPTEHAVRRDMVTETETERILRQMISEMQPHYNRAMSGEFQPRRDDAVAAWLKSRRDEYTRNEVDDVNGWFVLDNLLDDYRLHADTGAPLSTPTDELGPHGPGEVR